MKHVILIILFTLFLFESCTNSNSLASDEERAISEYVQRIGTTKTDLSFKMKELKFIRDISRNDSLNWCVDNYSDNQDTVDVLLSTLPQKVKTNKESWNKLLARYDRALKDFTNTNYKTHRKGHKDMLEIDIEMGDLREVVAHDSIFSEKLALYKENREEIIAKEYRAIYTIKNPILNNVEQELSKTFYLTPDRTRVIRVK